MNEKSSVHSKSEEGSQADSATTKVPVVAAYTHSRPKYDIKYCIKLRSTNSSFRWQRVPFISSTAPPPKASLDDADIIPEVAANLFNLATFGWVTGLLALGYTRPLEATDLYKLQDHRGAAVIGEKITRSFAKRHKDAADYNARLLNGDIKPGLKAVWWTIRGNRAGREKQWREKDGQRKPSLVYAINDSVKWWFWSSAIFKIIGDTAQVVSPVFVKVRQP